MRLLSLYLTVLVVMATSSWASPEVVGKVVMLKGQASIIPHGTITEKTLSLGDSIARGDSITTKTQSIVKIEMKDDSVLVFGPQSKFNLRQFEYQEGKVRRAQYDLMEGQLRAKFSHIKSGKNKVEVHTRSVSLGIRGTEVLINQVVKAKGQYQTQASLLSGKAVVMDKHTKKLTELFPGAIFVADSGTSGQMIKNYLPKDKLEQLDRGLKLPGMDPNASDFALAGAQEDNRSVDEMSEELFLGTQVIDLPAKKKSPTKKK